MSDDDPAHANPASKVQPFWETVIDDMEATAAEYREAGWEAVECHPGDVTAVAADDWAGLDAILPESELSAVETAVGQADAAFDECEVFSAAGGGMVFVVAAIEDEATETVLLVPAYYDRENGQEMLAAARAQGRLFVRVRGLQEERVFMFGHDDVSLFAPPEDAEGEEE